LLEVKKGESKMFLEEQFCSRCGVNLKCPSCGGSGKEKDLLEDYLGGSQGEYCCGQINFESYCSRCGRFIKPLYELPKHEKRCICCNGTGKISHFCGF